MISVLLVVLCIILTQAFYQPYENAFFGMLEQLGLAACASIIFVALYQHNVEIFSNEWAGIIGSTVAIVVNVAFILVWLISALVYLCKKVNECRQTYYNEEFRHTTGYFASIRPCQVENARQQFDNPAANGHQVYTVHTFFL